MKNSTGTTVASYTYEVGGRRITETHGDTTTDVYFDSQGQVVEERQGGYVTKQYVWNTDYVNDLLVQDTFTASTTFTTVYAQHDANFNITAMVNTSGAVQQRFVYSPYGVQTVLDGSWAVVSGAADSVYGFQGGRYDAATGLIKFGARDYDPATGTWDEADPAGYVDGSDRFQFVRDDPYSKLDPTGLWHVDIWMYLQRPTLPANFDVSAVQSALNGMMATVTPKKDEYKIHLTVSQTSPEVGWRYDAPGGFPGFGGAVVNNWDWVPGINIGRSIYRQCTRRKTDYYGWVMFSPLGGVGFAYTNGYQTQVDAQHLEDYVVAEMPANRNPAWAMIYANLLAHEQLHLGVIGSHDYGSAGQISSGQLVVNQPETGDAAWDKKFFDAMEIE